MADDGPNDWITPPKAPQSGADDWVSPGGTQANKPAEMRAYHPSTMREIWSKKLMDLMDDPNAHPYIKAAIERVFGSTGLGHTSTGVMDFTPPGMIDQTREGLAAIDRLRPSIKQQRAGAPAEYNLKALPEALGTAIGGLPFGRQGGEPVYKAVAGGFGPESRAARQLGQAGQRDVAAAHPRPGGEPGMFTGSTVSPQELEQRANRVISNARTRGQEPRLMDVGAGDATTPGGAIVPSRQGAETRRITTRAREASGTARGILEEVTPRGEQQPGRLIDWLKNWFGNPELGEAALKAEQTRRQNLITPAYERAYRSGDIPMTEAGLAKMFDSDWGKKIIEDAEKRMELLRTTGSTKFRFTIPIKARGKKPYDAPTLAYWDQVKRELDGKIGAETNNTVKMAYINARNRLKDWLMNYPGAVGKNYRAALGPAAERFKVGDAFELGERIASGNYSVAELNHIRSSLNADELEWMQTGFLKDYLKRVGRMNLIERYRRFPAEREKVFSMLGPTAAREFEAVLATEVVFNASRRAAVGGSETVGRAAAHLDQPPSWKDQLGPHALVSAAMMMAFQDWRAILAGALTYGGRRLQQAQVRKTADALARMLVSQNPAIYRQGIKQIATIPILDNVFRHYAARGISTEAETQIEDRTGDQRQAPGMPAPMHLGGPKPEPEEPGVDASVKPEPPPSIDPKVLKTLEAAGLPTIPAAAMNPEIQDMAKRWMSAPLGPLGVGKKILEGEPVESLTKEDAGQLLKLPGPGMLRAAIGEGALGATGGKLTPEMLARGRKAWDTYKTIRAKLEQYREQFELLKPKVAALKDSKALAEHQRQIDLIHEEIKKADDAIGPIKKQLDESEGPGWELGAFGSKPTSRFPARSAGQSGKASNYDIMNFWKVLDASGGDPAKAAKALGVPRETILARLADKKWQRKEAYRSPKVNTYPTSRTGKMMLPGGKYPTTQVPEGPPLSQPRKVAPSKPVPTAPKDPSPVTSPEGFAVAYRQMRAGGIDHNNALATLKKEIGKERYDQIISIFMTRKGGNAP